MSVVVTAAARTDYPPLNLHRRSTVLRRKLSISALRFPLRSFSVRMSSSGSDASPIQIVEHIVLFKVKPSADLSAVTAMVANLNGLSSLDSVLHISTGPVSRCWSGSSLTFTHVLHSRYRSRSGLDAYSEHPAHVGVVSDFVKPVVDDVMAVDWIADGFSGSAVVVPGSELRLSVLKLKSDVGEGGKGEALGLLGGIKDKIPSIAQLTAGENFSPGRAKGYSICSIAVFRKPNELVALDPPLTELRNVGDLVDDALVLDFAVGAPAQTANL